MVTAYGFRSQFDSTIRSIWRQGRRIGKREFRFIPQREDKLTLCGEMNLPMFKEAIEKFPVSSLSRPHDWAHAEYTYLTTPE